MVSWMSSSASAASQPASREFLPHPRHRRLHVRRRAQFHLASPPAQRLHPAFRLRENPRQRRNPPLHVLRLPLQKPRPTHLLLQRGERGTECRDILMLRGSGLDRHCQQRRIRQYPAQFDLLREQLLHARAKIRQRLAEHRQDFAAGIGIAVHGAHGNLAKEGRVRKNRVGGDSMHAMIRRNALPFVYAEGTDSRRNEPSPHWQKECPS